MNPEVFNVATLCTLSALLVTSVVIEFRSNRIPNWLTFAGVLSGLLIAYFDRQWSTHLWGLGLGFGLAFVVFIFGMGGAGFVKLMAAVGAILGPIVTFTTTLVGIVLFLTLYFTEPKVIPDELQYQDERPRINSVKGSLIALVGSIIGVVLFYTRYADVLFR